MIAILSILFFYFYFFFTFGNSILYGVAFSVTMCITLFYFILVRMCQIEANGGILVLWLPDDLIVDIVMLVAGECGVK